MQSLSRLSGRVKTENLGNLKNGMLMQVREISVGMRGILVEMRKIWGGQGGDAGNQGGNLSKLVEMT